MVSAEERQILEAIKGRLALEQIENLCRFGDRFVGTEGDYQARDYIIDQFQALGLEVRLTEIEAPSFRELEPARLELPQAGIELEGLSPYLGPPTPPGGIEAEIVGIGQGEEEDLARVEVGGKLGLMREQGLGYLKFWLGTIAERAAAHGALGLIVIHPMPWPYRNSMEAGNSQVSRRFCDTQLPAICLSAVQGAELMYQLGRGQTQARLLVNTVIEDKKSAVVSGIKKGEGPGDERVAVLAHRDTAVPPGANDNTSGTACMLELARVLAPRRSALGFEFISTTAEDGATLGAYLYCQEHKDELQKNLKALIDIDMVSVGGQIKQVEKGLWPDSDPIYATGWLMDLVDQVAEELGYYFGRMEASWGVAESARFLEIGVPSTWFWAPDDPYYHSTQDTPDKINPNSLKSVMDVSALVMWRLANP